MPFKDDIRQLADLQPQILQKMILLVQHIALMSLCCEVILSFVIFAVLDLRVCSCHCVTWDFASSGATVTAVRHCVNKDLTSRLTATVIQYFTIQLTAIW